MRNKKVRLSLPLYRVKAPLKAISFDQTPKEVLDEEQIFDIP